MKELKSVLGKQNREIRIVKSSRHPKIIGNFGESLICNWLSRSGFEVILVDHTGIDIIAYNPQIKKRLGISVKSRTRPVGGEGETINLLVKNDRQKLLSACKAFACEPWVGLYVETLESADVFLTSLKNYDKEYRGKGSKVDGWKMKEKDKEQYKKDPEVHHIRMQFHIDKFFNTKC